SPHLIFVFFVPTLPISSPVLRRAAYRIGDPAFPLFRAAFPFPVQLCIKAFLPDELKVSCFSSRAKPNFASYPQAVQFAVDKIGDKISVQKDTAPTQCMEAVKNCPGRGREGGGADRSILFGNCLPLQPKYERVGYAAIAKRTGWIA
ncbi:hypothetical protein, partial [Sphingorhabdus sp.]|uniref:hypothetical protein n=1 Tax=Sphingorhabdus sp. TaxID=1902408 RepID=UPI002637ECEF